MAPSDELKDGAASPAPGKGASAPAGVLRARWSLVLLIVLGALAGGVGWLALRSPEYTARAEFMVTPLPADDRVFLGLPVLREAGDPATTAQTAVELLRSPLAGERAARRLGPGWNAQRVLDAVTMEPEGASGVIAVTATGAYPAEAIRVANAFARGTWELRSAAFRRTLEAFIRRLDAQDSPGRARPRSEASAERVVLLEEARRTGDPTISLAELARGSETLDGPGAGLILLAALLGGLVLGAGAALLVERLGPRRLRSEYELAEIWPAPVLARLPCSVRRRTPWLARRASESGAEDLALRELALELGLAPGRPRCVMLTSATGADGKTSVITSLALRLASERQSVVAMDLDLVSPTLATALRVPPDPNIGAALQPGGRLGDAAVIVRGSRFFRVVPGLGDARIATLAELGERLPTLVAEAREQGSHVLLESRPLDESPDVLALLEAVDELVVVVELGRTSVSALHAVRKRLERSRAAVAGFVLTGVAPPRRTVAPLLARRAAPVPASAPGAAAHAEPAYAADGLARATSALSPGDRVQWKRGRQTDTGIVERKLTAPTTVGGRRVVASDAEPRYLVRNERSGKQAAHKARALIKVPEEARPGRSSDRPRSVRGR